MYIRPIYKYTWNNNMSALISTDGIFKNMCSHGTKVFNYAYLHLHMYSTWINGYGHVHFHMFWLLL